MVVKNVTTGNYIMIDENLVTMFADKKESHKAKTFSTADTSDIVFEVEQSIFKEFLLLVKPAISIRPTYPILNNLLIKVKSSSAHLIAFDIKKVIDVQMPLNSSASRFGNNSFLVPFKQLERIITKLPSALITCYVDTADWQKELDDYPDSQLIIECENYKFSLPVLHSSKYMDVPMPTKEEQKYPLTFSNELFFKALNHTLFCSDLTAANPVYTACYLAYKDEKLEFAVTDGHRLSHITYSANSLMADPTKRELAPFQVVIPIDLLQIVAKFLKVSIDKDYDFIGMVFSDSLVQFHVPDGSITTRLLSPYYPAFHSLIPTKFKMIITIDRDELLSALTLLSVVANEASPLVFFFLQNSFLKLKASHDNDNGSVDLSVILNDNTIEQTLNFGLNPVYVIQFLKAVAPSELVKLAVNDGKSPMCFYPCDGSTTEHLIMPITTTPT